VNVEDDLYIDVHLTSIKPTSFCQSDVKASPYNLMLLHVIVRCITTQQLYTKIVVPCSYAMLEERRIGVDVRAVPGNMSTCTL